jgi:hypothetical protein
MKEIGVPGQTLSHNVESRFDLKTLVALIASRLATGWWFSPDPPVSSTNKTDILLKVALNTIKQTNK